MFNKIKQWREGAKAKQELERQRQAEEEAEQRQLRAEINQANENILAILSEDKLPDADWSALEPLPFRFQKTEHLIYIFRQVGYAEQRVKREIVGRSAGTSLRVRRGMSVRLGASRGTPIERDEIVSRGIGMMAVTDRHLYFNGERSFRIRFDKIVSVEPRADGVEVTRDRASGLAEYFIVGDFYANFAYELMHAIPSLDLPKEPERHDPMGYHLLMLPTDVGDDVIHD